MFFDRQQETAELFKLLKNGKNILMLAPRRVGKTELMHHVAGLAHEHGLRAIVFDMEGYRSEKDFFHQLCSAIQEELGTGAGLMATFASRLKSLMSGSNEASDWRQILMNSDWREFADHLLAELAQDKNGQQWLIMVDELPIFIRDLLNSGDKQRAETFLYWLRNARQKHRNLRWLYTGSIGLDALSRREDMEGALLDLHSFPLKPFAPDIAAGFLKALAEQENCRFEESAIMRLLEVLGWLSPYYLEKLAEQAFAEVRKNGGTMVTEDVAQVALDALLQLENRVYWAAWREHLTKNFTDPDRTKLFQVLELIARNGPAPVSRDTLLANIHDTAANLGYWLDTLEADGYLVADLDRQQFSFQMNLLRLWWLRYVVGSQ